jgi:hypothetical protein
MKEKECKLERKKRKRDEKEVSHVSSGTPK